MKLLSQHVYIFSAVTRNFDLKAAHRVDLITFCRVSVIDYLLGVPRMSRTDKGITQMAQPVLVLRLDDYMKLNKDSSSDSVQVLALFWPIDWTQSSHQRRRVTVDSNIIKDSSASQKPVLDFMVCMQ